MGVAYVLNDYRQIEDDILRIKSHFSIAFDDGKLVNAV